MKILGGPELPILNRLFVAIVLLVLTGATCMAQSESDNIETLEKALMERAQKLSTGDLPKISKSRFLRVLVTYSKTNFFMDAGTARGFEYELLKEYEKFLNKGIKKKTKQIKLFYIPMPFDKLLAALREGRGDIVAAGLTITPERQKRVDFSDPYMPNVSEVVVLNKKVGGLNTINDLGGRTVYVRAGSSYVTHLKSLSQKLVQAGQKPITVKEADGILTTEDILEMVNAGVVDISVADDHIAEIWADLLPNIVVRKDLAINSGGRIAWAVRKNNPKLKASLNAFTKTVKKGSLLGNILFKRYYQNAKWIKNPTSPGERKKLEAFIELFEKYSKRYGFDWLAVAAQGYQESGLDQSKRSHAGAVGIMQLLPSTAADKSVNIKNIKIAEHNIHAGVKYLSFLRNRYFNDPKIEPSARVDFAWAAYNAGPARINSMRQRAAKRGFNPNKWFGHVETVTAELVGREPVDYVANINKYYISYKLLYEAAKDRQKALSEIDGIESAPIKASTGETSTDDSPKIITAPSPETDGPAKHKPKVSLKATTKKSSPAPRVRYHTIRSGETLYSIGIRYGLGVDELTRLNHLNPKSTLRIGDKLRISR
ncbi:MAG: transporter substrate-binding domain-containing protein [Thermodesulfobacteriota bacterium]|nr:transporter substrate-binding domain-containing protein [Thermodesulfobacteriota bacterium]